MDKKVILPGFRFGMLEVVSEVPRRKGHRVWLCRCDCGAQTEVNESHLKTGHTKSCGCLRIKRGQQKAFDLYGRRFDRLTVVGHEPERHMEGGDHISRKTL